MNRTIVSWLALALLVPGLGYAQGSGKSNGSERLGTVEAPSDDDPFARFERDPFSVTRSLDATVVGTDAARGVIEIEDEDLQRFAIPVAGVRLEADKNSGVRADGDLSAGDFPIGVTVKVTYRPSDEQVIEIKARSAKKESFDGVVIDVILEESALVVEDDDGMSHRLHVDGDTEFEADRQANVADRDNLSLSSFTAGLRVEVEYRVFDGLVLKLKARKP